MSLRQRLLAMARCRAWCCRCWCWRCWVWQRGLRPAARHQVRVGPGGGAGAYFERAGQSGATGTGDRGVARAAAGTGVAARRRPVALAPVQGLPKSTSSTCVRPDGTLRFTDGLATDTDSRSPAFTAAVEAVERNHDRAAAARRSWRH